MTGQSQLHFNIAVSACLLGQQVRYDGADKKNDFVVNVLAKMAHLLPVCPEVEIGLGVPRRPIQLVERGGLVRAVGVEDPTRDVTAKLVHLGKQRARMLDEICGYIFKARSPSCGVNSTPVKHENRRDSKGAGIYTAQIIKAYPLLPVIEEQGLTTTAQQRNFLQRAAAYQRWRAFLDNQPGWRGLKQFHHSNYYLLMMHGIEGLRGIDRWLAAQDLSSRLRHEQLCDYGERYMAQFARQASQRRQAFVLRRCIRVLRPVLSARQTARLGCEVEKYLAAESPLAHVITQLKGYQQRARLPELMGQTCLETTVWHDLYI